MSAPTDEGGGGGGPPAPTARMLTILYDEWCPLCLRVRDWLLTQPCLLEVELLAAGSPEAQGRYGSVPWLGKELVVADDLGRVWVGPPAYLTALWATVRYRSWAYRLARPGLAPVAAQFFRFISNRRYRWGAKLEVEDPNCSFCDRMRIEYGNP